jgi:hypothetical protein
MTTPAVIQVNADVGPGVIEVRTGAIGPSGADGVSEVQPHDYVDIRDYHVGTLVDGDDITAAVLAAFLAGSTHKLVRYRIPRLGTVGFVLDPVAVVTGGGNWFTKIIEIDAPFLLLKSTWNMSSNLRIMGRGTTSSSTFQSGPAPRPIIKAESSSTVDPIIGFGVNGGQSLNSWIENVEVQGDTGNAVKMIGTNLITLRNCEFGTDAAATPLWIDQCFWINVEDCFCQPRTDGTEYAMEITNAVDYGVGNGTDCGLLRFKNFRCADGGILISASYGPTGTNNIIFDEVISENFAAAAAPSTYLFTLDSGADGVGTASVGNITIINAEIADATGTVYYITNSNTNALTRGVSYEGFHTNRLVDTASDPIDWLQVRWRWNNTGSSVNPQNLHALWPGTQQQETTSVHYPNASYNKLLSAPIGLPWVIGTNVPVIQTPSGWGGTVTSSIPGPDGSTNAGTLTAGTATFYTGTQTLNVGDYILAGVWIRGSTPSSLTLLKMEVGAGNDYNGDTDEFFLSGDGNYPMEDKVNGMGWRWMCKLLKMTTATAAPTTVTFKAGNTDQTYFMPSMVIVPAATSGITDAWMLNYARSVRGGWSASAEAGEIAFPDHQRVVALGGIRTAGGLVTEATSAYTLAVTDGCKTIEMNNSSASVVTIPPTSSAAIPIGTYYNIVRRGAGTVTLTTGSGVTLNSVASARGLTSQYSVAIVYKSTSNTWIASGSLS